MSTEPDTSAQKPADSAGPIARSLVREAWKATLGTLARDGGHPYGSLVAIATEPDGVPLLLLSGLAEHTRNIKRDQRASLLIDGTGRGQGALTGARVTLVGTLSPTASTSARDRYLARHPDAARFIDFADFDLYALDITWAHLVAGFGRIDRLTRADVVLALAGSDAVIAAEAAIVAHMNADHADALALMAAHALGSVAGSALENGGNNQNWRMLACDPEGLDLACGDRALRIAFPQCIKTPEDVRRALAEMTALARRRPADA